MKKQMLKGMLLITDFIIVHLAMVTALMSRFDGLVPFHYFEVYWKTFLLVSLVSPLVFRLFGLYKCMWKYASLEELTRIFFATLSSTLLLTIIMASVNRRFPLTVYFLFFILTFLLVSASRFSVRYANQVRQKVKGRLNKRIMVIGAGETGALIIRELNSDSNLNGVPVVAIDDDVSKQGKNLNGVPVIGGREKILHAFHKYRVDEIILAVPTASIREKAEILKICKETKSKIKTLPSIFEFVNHKAGLDQIRDVKIEDLLGREVVGLNNEKIAAYLTGETVLVTGGGGSIGSELCRQIALFQPKKLVIFDIYENNAYDIQNEMKSRDPNLDLEVAIGSVREMDRLETVFAQYKPGVVFHAAAHKHVPLMEDCPTEAVKNNVFGTLKVAKCADKYGVKKFVLISTDKAVNPVNIMGATKRLAEMVTQSINRTSKTEFAAVRFGNVLGSNGSVIPLFRNQIKAGGPVTVTDPNIIRYFMTIPEAAQLVIQAGAIAKGGEIFVLDMGEPVKIDTLARDLIKLSGLEPDVDIPIVYSGLRPGEKLYEELLMGEEGLSKTAHEKIFVGTSQPISYIEVLQKLKTLEQCMEEKNSLHLCMERVLDTYRWKIVTRIRNAESMRLRKKQVPQTVNRLSFRRSRRKMWA